MLAGLLSYMTYFIRNFVSTFLSFLIKRTLIIVWWVLLGMLLCVVHDQFLSYQPISSRRQTPSQASIDTTWKRSWAHPTVFVVVVVTAAAKTSLSWWHGDDTCSTGPSRVLLLCMHVFHFSIYLYILRCQYVIESLTIDITLIIIKEIESAQRWIWYTCLCVYAVLDREINIWES